MNESDSKFSASKPAFYVPLKNQVCFFFNCYLFERFPVWDAFFRVLMKGKKSF